MDSVSASDGHSGGVVVCAVAALVALEINQQLHAELLTSPWPT
jgi:hypothetical protein